MHCLDRKTYLLGFHTQHVYSPLGIFLFWTIVYHLRRILLDDKPNGLIRVSKVFVQIRQCDPYQKRTAQLVASTDFQTALTGHAFPEKGEYVALQQMVDVDCVKYWHKPKA